MSTKPTIHIDRYERSWLLISGIMLVVFVIAVSVAGFAMGIAVPSPQTRVDPRTVATEGPFAEPGLRELAPGKYEGLNERFNEIQVRIDNLLVEHRLMAKGIPYNS